jgi:hypothetical protein
MSVYDGCLNQQAQEKDDVDCSHEDDMHVAK